MGVHRRIPEDQKRDSVAKPRLKLKAGSRRLFVVLERLECLVNRKQSQCARAILALIADQGNAHTSTQDTQYSRKIEINF